METKTKLVYKAINAVQAALATEGIAKDRKNIVQSYNFRGIDDVYNALARILSDNRLCILPRFLNRNVLERTNKSGGALFYVTVEAEFDLVSAEDGSIHTVRTFGESMDSGDKATNKAMSAAYKYMAFQVFAIPTEGDNDSDAHTHEVSGKGATTAPAPDITMVIDHIKSINNTPHMDNFVKKMTAPGGDFEQFAQNEQARIKAAIALQRSTFKKPERESGQEG